MIRRILVILAFVFIMVFTVGAQESESLDAPKPLAQSEEVPEASLEDLFNTPVGDTVAVVSADDNRAAYESSPAIKFSGSFSATGGVAAGWVTWPVFTSLQTGYDQSIGAKATTLLSFDARPDPAFRVTGTMSTVLDPLSGNSLWPTFTITELFCDYILQDFVFIRLGQHTVAWGQGRLFTPGNLMVDSPSSFTVRATVPSWLNGVSASVQAYNGVKNYMQLAYSMHSDIVLGGVLAGAGIKYRDTSGLQGLVSFKTVLWHSDILFDGVVTYKDERFSYGFLTGFFRQWDDVILYGEYSGAFAASGLFKHNAGLVMGYNNILGATIDFAMKCMHNFSDNSGSILTGITWTPWKFVKVSLGVPVYYGPDTGEYVVANEDPSKRRLALALLVELINGF